MERKTGIEPV